MKCELKLRVIEPEKKKMMKELSQGYFTESHGLRKIIIKYGIK